MEKHHIGELDAALLIADEIDAARLRYQLGDDYVPEPRRDGEVHHETAAKDDNHATDSPQDGDERPEPPDAAAPSMNPPNTYPREPVLSLAKQIDAAQPEGRQDGDVIPVPHDDEADNSNEPVKNAPDTVATDSEAVGEEQHLSQDDHIPTRQEES